MSVQADLFGLELILENLAESSPTGWGRAKPVELVEPFDELPWGAYVITAERAEQQLARFLGRSAGYRAYRCILCTRAVVVAAAEWQESGEQVAKCPYASCSGWVQRDSDRVLPDWEPPPDPLDLE
jgi:hypothetical protein